MIHTVTSPTASKQISPVINAILTPFYVIPDSLKKAREIGGAAEIKNARLYDKDLLQTVADHEGTPFVFSGLSAASTNNGQQKAKKRKLTMWYFAWLLGLPLAAIFAVMNAMWLEMKEDEQTIAEGARALAPNPRV